MKTVLEDEIILSREHEKTNICREFVLGHDAEKIKITFSYSPKELTDEAEARRRIRQCLLKDSPNGVEPDAYVAESFMPLVNLVTVSLDSPSGYRGCAHRHSPWQEHILTENECSPGFLRGRLCAGKWRIMLNVHAVVTDICTCKLKVEVGEGDKNG